MYHFRRANSEWLSKFPPGHWALGLQKLGLVQFRSCAWRCPANIPGTNPGGPVWDRPLREQHSRSYIRRRGGSKTRPQNLPLGKVAGRQARRMRGPAPITLLFRSTRRGGTLGRPGTARWGHRALQKIKRTFGYAVGAGALTRPRNKGALKKGSSRLSHTAQ